MRTHRVVRSLALATAFLAQPGFTATQGLSLNFTAVIEETTCVMMVSSLSNASLSGSGTQYALTVPNIGIAELLNTTANTESSFKLQPKECNNEISSISNDHERHHTIQQQLHAGKQPDQRERRKRRASALSQMALMTAND
ncbi:fimbrial protein [Salmonella bongori]|nr:fimbrial protein [Salmonella bongori]